MENRHKMVLCDICKKSMRSDHLKRHMQVHKDLLLLPDDEIKEELRIRQQFKEKKELRKHILHLWRLKVDILLYFCLHFSHSITLILVTICSFRLLVVRNVRLPRQCKAEWGGMEFLIEFIRFLGSGHVIHLVPHFCAPLYTCAPCAPLLGHILGHTFVHFRGLNAK